ncbi:acyltransferase family-domain-containing protein [Microdochium trichocladiopsis]|uniref:Acyltransferase family-domain-containing protein n=1 Tax=Microdochium trichocladiopsis TaxID=1682393 RepID=A0A9P9BT47_9PEZI|nr:acyltransferase family-domain-containing protein [Microdochium trichocladiopsis]KAH7029471.1 acyltransferase family-domain-containing protein [Microdochium trichocladiopsis]
MFNSRAHSPKAEDAEALLPSSASRSSSPVLAAQLPRPALNPARTFRRFLSFLKPSFLHRVEHSDISEKTSRPPSRTEYLDGVRGVASLIVFNLHWIHVVYPSVNSGWGYKHHELWLLPFVRLFYSGAAMVSIFFIVSGFVLSHRFIQRMHRGEDIFNGLTSLIFRRFIRLFLPAFASSFMAYVCASVGVLSVPDKNGGKPFHHGIPAFVDYLDLESNPWDWELAMSGWYNPQLWSISVEFRGSMVVFLMIAGLAKTRTSVRLLVENLVMVHAFGHKRWDVALFIAGMIVAELEVLTYKSQQGPRRRWVTVLLVATLLLGVFLTGYPRENNTKTPGYMWSKYVWPFTAYRRRFWLGIGSILVVGPMAFLPSIQAFFLTRPVRYLGRISFALYLVHGLGNKTIGKALLHAGWGIFGSEGYWQYAAGFVMASVIYYPIVIWASDVFWRAVDVPSTDFARWVEKKSAAR